MSSPVSHASGGRQEACSAHTPASSPTAPIMQAAGAAAPGARAVQAGGWATRGDGAAQRAAGGCGGAEGRSAGSERGPGVQAGDGAQGADCEDGRKPSVSSLHVARGASAPASPLASGSLPSHRHSDRPYPTCLVSRPWRGAGSRCTRRRRSCGASVLRRRRRWWRRSGRCWCGSGGCSWRRRCRLEEVGDGQYAEPRFLLHRQVSSPTTQQASSACRWHTCHPPLFRTHRTLWTPPMATLS